MLDLNEVLVFVRVVDAGSFTGAAQKLEVRKSTISRKISSLEERIGVRLLHRTTRQLRLTEAGATLYERASRMLSELEEAEREVADTHATPRGTLRVTAPVDIGMLYIGPLVAQFMQAYPDVRLQLTLTSRLVDVVDEGYDVAIRAGSMPDSSLVVRRLAHVHFLLVAAPSYLDASAPIKAPRDLEHHDFIVFDQAPFAGPLTLRQDGQTVSVRPARKMRCNNFGPILDSLVAGNGIAQVPDFHCAPHLRSGALRQVLPQWSSGDGQVYAVYPSRRLVAAKVRSFLDFLSDSWKASAWPQRVPAAVDRH